jgi:F-type H+-transporting ATPase subunit gamma
MDTLEDLRRKLEGAGDLKSVVRTMKTIAASNIGQYETAVQSLGDYYHTIVLGLYAYFKQENQDAIEQERTTTKNTEKTVRAIVFGSDQGLVAQFNDLLADFVSQSIGNLSGKKEIWAVGLRVELLLSDLGFPSSSIFPVPNSVNGIAPLVSQILLKSEESIETGNVTEIYIFHNQPKSGAGYVQTKHRLLPLDKTWKNTIAELQWPTKIIPQITGGTEPTLLALIHEYLFTSLFKACAESLASENASRLAAMQRAEKNIDELLIDLNNNFHRMRQNSIDEELFDVVSGFEALRDDNRKR